MNKIILEYDDFCSQKPENCLDTINWFIDKIPNIKFNLFTIPFKDNKLNDLKWQEQVEKLIASNNVRLCVHGYNHSFLEFKNLNYHTSSIYLKLIDQYKLTWPSNSWLSVFRGPYWGLNEDSIKSLIDYNYTHIYNHNDYKYLESIFSNQIKFVYYNQNLKDPIISNDLMIIHGHTHNVCDNGIEETKNKLFSYLINNNVEYLWADQV